MLRALSTRTSTHTHTHTQSVRRRCLTHLCGISDGCRCRQRDRWFGRGPCGYEGRGQASITDSLCTWLSRQVCIKGRVLPRLPLVVVCVCLCRFVFVCAYVRVCACAYVCVHVCIYVRVLESVCVRARACERARSRARRYNRPCAPLIFSHRQQQPIPRSMGNRNRLYSTVLNKERTSREREALGADIAGMARPVYAIRRLGCRHRKTPRQRRRSWLTRFLY